MRFVTAPDVIIERAEKFAGRELERRSGSTERSEDVVLPGLEAVEIKGGLEVSVDGAAQAADATDDPDRARIEVGPFERPLVDDPIDMVVSRWRHDRSVATS